MSAPIRRGRLRFSSAIIRGWMLTLGLVLGAVGFAGCSGESTDSDPDDLDIEQVDAAQEEVQTAPDGLVDVAGAPDFAHSSQGPSGPADQLQDLGTTLQTHDAPGSDRTTNDPDGGQEPDPHPWRTSTDADPDNDPHASANLI